MVELNENVVSQKIDRFLKALPFTSYDKKEQLKVLARAVSQIPWGEARSIEEVFNKGVGTCTGKHSLFQACLDRIGVENGSVVCTFDWEEQGIQFPHYIKEILSEGSWPHGHNFVRIEGKYDLDLTWDSALSTLAAWTLARSVDQEQLYLWQKRDFGGGDP